MTYSAFAACLHIRNAVLCALVTVGLAACGADSGAGASAASVVTPHVGFIDRAPVGGKTPVPSSPPVTSTGPGSKTPAPAPAPRPVSAGTATLDWTPPTENTDGSTLTNLAGYTVYYGKSPNSLTASVKVSNPGLSAYTLSNLPSGTWYFSVTSYSATGVESSRSAVISTKI